MGLGFNSVLGLVILMAEIHVNINVSFSDVEALVVTGTLIYSSLLNVNFLIDSYFIVFAYRMSHKNGN